MSFLSTGFFRAGSTAEVVCDRTWCNEKRLQGLLTFAGSHTGVVPTSSCVFASSQTLQSPQIPQGWELRVPNAALPKLPLETSVQMATLDLGGLSPLW